MKNTSKKELKYRSKIISLTSMKKRNQYLLDLHIKNTDLSYKQFYFYMTYRYYVMLKILGLEYNRKHIKKCEKVVVDKKIGMLVHELDNILQTNWFKFNATYIVNWVK